jgi:PKD repeat protein
MVSEGSVGWVALYDPQGNPVDAIYWNSAPGNAFSLSVEQEYQQPIVNTMGCTGTLTLSAAANIPGITYVGNINSGSNTSFQRVQDGAPVWHPSPVPITPRGPNGIPIAPPTLSFSVTPDFCDYHTGIIHAHITSGGTQPYTIYWNGSATPGDSVLVQLAAGVYTIEVLDAYNCLFTRDTIIVPSAPGPEIQILSVVDETCSGINGSILVNVTGGLPPYSYAWNTTPVITAGSLVGIPAGNYELTVTDVNGCIAHRSVTLNNHAEPVVTTTLLSPDSCGYGLGSALALATGDHPPYQYLWNTLPMQTNPVAVNMPSGTYSVTVTDGVCTVVTTILVPLIPGPLADFLASPTVVYIENALVQFTDMSPGQVTTWLWDFGDGAAATNQNPSHLYFNTGTYTVTLTVIDNIGCEGSATKTVRVKDITTIFFPNAFTPDGDGLNDILCPRDPISTTTP